VRMLALSIESYPGMLASSYILMHQAMALEELGHEVHVFNIFRHALTLFEYLQLFEFDAVMLDLEVLRNDKIWRTLRQYRRVEPVRVVGSLYKLGRAPDSHALDVVDLIVTPWTGQTVEKLAEDRDVRYLPLAYNRFLHHRKTHLPSLGPVFIGNTTGGKTREAEERLKDLARDHAVLCVGPAFPQNYLDPFMVGPVYAASRCLPNFHYEHEKGDDLMLNERFWQTARCGIPVNDYNPLMAQVWDRKLVETFAFADKCAWQDRVRALNSGAIALEPGLLGALDKALEGHSYTDRMKTLLGWLR
jgi:hypothetical protein